MEEANIECKVVDEAVETGVLTTVSGVMRIHPLLREYVLTGAVADDREKLHQAADHACDIYLRRGDSDRAFFACARAQNPNGIGRLLAEASVPALREGRLATVKGWLELSRLHPRTSIADAVEAQIAFREGRFTDAAALATEACAQESLPHAMRAPTLLIAGLSYYFTERYDVATDRFDTALTCARGSDAVEARRGRVLTAVSMERADAEQVIDEYLSLLGDSPTEIVRGAATLAYASFHFGNVDSARERAHRAMIFLDQVSDPMHRSGFLSGLAHAHILAGSYHEALRTAERCVSEVTESGLDFALPHVLLHLARARAGIGDLDEAENVLAVARESLSPDDLYATLNLEIAALRLAVAGRDYEPRVIAATLRDAAKSLQAEYYSVRALYDVRRGDRAAAASLIARSRGLSRTAEVRVLNAWATAVASHRPSVSLAETALATSLATGIWDPLVTALHADQRLAEIVLALPVSPSQRVAAAFVEEHRVRRNGTRVDLGLSPRETDVLTLIARGLTNRQIADELSISEATAKVHVRHVCAKLGVRTRTQAAVLALRKRRD